MGDGDAGGACGGWVAAGMTGGEHGDRSLLDARGLDPLGPLLPGGPQSDWYLAHHMS